MCDTLVAFVGCAGYVDVAELKTLFLATLICKARLLAGGHLTVGL